MSEIDKVKKYVRSTLLSNKGSVSIHQLDDDYRELVGENIPYHKLNFSSLQDFLAAVPDVCRLDSYDMVSAVAGVANSHIKDMVSKQKITGTKKRNRGYKPMRLKNEDSGEYSNRRCYSNYNSYSFGIDDDESDNWDSYAGLSKSEKDKCPILKAVPAGFEDSEESDGDFSCNYFRDEPMCPSSPVTTVETTGRNSEVCAPTKTIQHDVSTSLSFNIPSPSLAVNGVSEALVKVSYVISPHQFYLQMQGVDNDYQNLSNSMDNYYLSDALSLNLLDNLVKGSIVAARFHDHWYRGEITVILKSHFMVCVRLVDVGKIILVTNRTDIQPLASQFFKLPERVVCAKLSKLKPSSGSCWWPFETEWFRKTVLDQEFVAVIDRESGDSVLTDLTVKVQLWHIKDNELSVSVSTEMLDRQLALEDE